MLVPEFSYYINLGLWYLRLVVLLSFPVIGYVIRRKWEFAVAKEVEIRRLMALAAAETEEEAGYYAHGSVNTAAFGFRGDGGVEGGLIGHCHEVVARGEVALRNVEARKCAVCLSPAMGRCSNCKSVWYCSTKCQIFDWREGHKDKCYPPCIPSQTSTEEIYHQVKKVTLADPVQTQDRQFNPSTHLGKNAVCSIGPKDQINGKNVGMKAKTIEELTLLTSDASLSTTFSSNSSLSSTTSYSSDDSSATESSDPSDLKKSDGFQHDDTSNKAKSVTELAHQTKQCDPDGIITIPSEIQTRLVFTQPDNQITSSNTPSLFVECCDHSVAEPGPSDFWEGAVGYKCSKSDKTKSHAKNDCLSSIGSSLSCASCLHGKIDESCHLNRKLHGSYTMINETSSENVSSKKIDLSSSEVAIPVLTNSSIQKQLKDVDNNFLKTSSDNDSKRSSSATVLSPPDGKSQGDSQRESIPPVSSNEKGNSTTCDTFRKSHHRPSASNGDEIVHSVNGDDSCQTNEASHSRSAGSSLLFAGQLGNAVNSSEYTEQLLKTKVVRSLYSTSHAKNIEKAASCLTDVDVVKSNINAATCDKCNSHKVANDLKMPTWKTVDQSQPSNSSRRLGADEKEANKGGFSYELLKSLYRWNKIELQPRGLLNCGNSCYANAVLQCLMFTPPLTAYLLERHHSRSCTKMDWCFTCEFENLILKVKDGKSPISPIGIISQIQNIGSHLSYGRQEDSHEFLRCVVDTMQSLCLKEAINKISGNVEERTTLLSLTFGGYLQSKIRCLKCGNKSERSERIMDLSVEIEGSIGSLEDALKRFTSSETLDGENKYNCGRCKSYQTARKKLTILESPNILTIALKRFQAGEFGKLSKWIEFPQILNMAPYMSGLSDDIAPVYDLYGVIVHLDTMNAAFSGHYACYIKNIQKKWFKIDDSVVKISDFSEVKKQSAYMLLYARCMPKAPRHLRDKLISGLKPEAAPPLTIYSSDSDSSTTSEFRSLQQRAQSKNLHSLCSTDNSIRESNISDDLSDLKFSDSGRGVRHNWNCSSNSDGNSPSSVSPL